MQFCKYCGKEIHESASACPNCGGIQQSQNTKNEKVPMWIPISSLVLGIISLIIVLDDSPWDQETLIGTMIIFVLPSITFGCIGLAKQREGRGLSIAGIVLASFSLIILAGISINLSN